MTTVRLFDDAVMLDRSARRDDPDVWRAMSPHGMVATAHYRATEAGVAMLAAGGNAVDAAVASAFALGACEPAGSGIGGMAMVMVHMVASGETVALEGPCRAPKRATPELVGSGSRRHGYRAVAVPTNVATLAHALRAYGTLPAATVLAPAIAIAEDGSTLTPLQGELIVDYQAGLTKGNSGTLYSGLKAGDLLRQPVLARTLRRLAEAGFEDFYTGEIGAAIARDMGENDGFVSVDDLSEVPWPSERAPVVGSFGGWRVGSLAPPGGGNALLQMLHLLDELGAADLDPDSSSAAVLLATIIRRVRLDRRKYNLGGPDAPDLGSAAYAKAITPELRSELDGPGETSHISVMDRHGNTVALTQSIERSFGSKVMTPSLGFLYNGYMQGFKVKTKEHPHYLRPGAVARSNAGPTIVLAEGRPIAAVGSTGSERMTSSIAQTLLRLRRGASPYASVAAPRLHCTPEGEVLIEAARFAPAVLTALQSRGFRIKKLEPWSFTMGGLQLVTRDEDDYVGVAEPRRDGAAAGPERVEPVAGAP